MYNFIVRLNPETRDELYSDASESFMGFLLLEAIYCILSVGKPGFSEAMDDLDLEFPDETCQFDTSIEYLLEIHQKLNEDCGIFLDESEYCFNSDAHELIAEKLSTAILSLEEFNDGSELFCLDDVFKDPAIKGGFRFNALHFPERAAYCIMPQSLPDKRVVASLADLLGPDYNDPGIVDRLSLFDPNTLSFQNALFHQRS